MFTRTLHLQILKSIYFLYMNSSAKNIEQALEEFKTIDLNIDDSAIVDRSGITVWLPTEYKKKYDRFQALSNRRFGKLVQKLIKKAIDSVND